MVSVDLLKIQNQMEAPGDHARPYHVDDELHIDEDVEERHDWAGVPYDYSPFHPGYTTKHWLKVFRPS